jgi:3-isopropylmalate dehydratase small subunit
MTFEIDEFRKKMLLDGLDSVGLTLKMEDRISAFEQRNSTFAPSV